MAPLGPAFLGLPRDFSVYAGFGAPLAVADDRELVKKRADLEKRARRSAQPTWLSGEAVPSPRNR